MQSLESPGRLRYQPALDGVRGVAVAMVVLFHGGVSWMTGGYVGVSVFFTLSGYLITSLLVAERDATGRVALGEFYARRIRRLMPASLLCVAATIALGASGEYPTAGHLRREAVASVLQVANWNSLTQRVSYADLVLGGTGPLDHFWSLAVEEQFYWIWPLAFMAICRCSPNALRRTRLIVGLAALAIVAAPLIAWRWGPDVAYWSTPARLGEILTGAALAVLLSRPHTARTWWAVLAAIGSVAIVVAAVFLPTDHGLAYQGWLGVGSLASVALIAGLQVRSPLQRLLSARPIVALGRISYGVYLFHWPVFTLLTPARTNWSGLALLAARVIVTLVISVISFVVIEQPVRRWPSTLTRIAPIAAAMTMAVVAMAIVAVQVPATRFGAPVELQRQVAIAPSQSSLAPLVLDENEAASRPARVLVLGDSTAEALSAGLIRWASIYPERVQVSSLAAPGCGLVRSVSLRDDDGTLQSVCDEVLDRQLPVLLTQAAPDVVLVMVTLPDITPRTWDANEGELPAQDDRYRHRKSDDYARVIEQLAAAGVSKVLWLTNPLPSSAWLGYLNGPLDMTLWRSQQQSLTVLAATHPTLVTLLPFADWVEQREVEDPRRLRPDGLHLSSDAGEQAMNDYLAPAILLAAAGEQVCSPSRSCLQQPASG